jgi:hypothetical protein
VPYIPFQSNTTRNDGGSAIWREMWLHYRYRRDVFLAHYHKHSNIESTFTMIKVKFGVPCAASGTRHKSTNYS